ncbi:penicillin amidase [Planktotalea frisia]|uniref:Acyl-homoserine lactone acylase QuiP n=3 Tax=Rhodobacterales TaxID=204455 RepID=A0A1L9NZL6_9RHOB|nr:acyl-homoserine lactone acylase QuiP precursor [Planktotalea frisia]PZX35641.1 penicillin amidase [Planktotalea frisia]
MVRMRRLFRLLLRGFIAAAIITIVATALAIWLMTRSIPDYTASFNVEGLSAPVDIVRDAYAVPHIFGTNDPDVFFGLGVAHAQDRLWQMTLLRRIAQGRLSELFGRSTLAYDDFMRRLDLAEAARSSLSAQDDKTREALNAYAEGVNAWIEEINKGALGRGAPEFFLFESSIAPWRPEDSIAILKLFALQSSGQFQEEVLRARLSMLIPPARVSDLLPASFANDDRNIPRYFDQFPNARLGAIRFEPAELSRLSPLRSPNLNSSMLAWAATRNRTVSGNAVVAGIFDTQLAIPSLWYLAGLELQVGGVIGATIPGLPVILSGRNSSLAWSGTTSNIDDQDLFIEKLLDTGSREVLTPAGPRPIVSRPSVIRIRGEAPVTIRLERSENGPIIQSDLFGLSSVIPEGHIASLAWTGLSTNDTSISALMGLMTAKSTDQGFLAMRSFIAPAMTMIIADEENLANQFVGERPIRDPRNVFGGFMPAPGWLWESQWRARGVAKPSNADDSGMQTQNDSNIGQQVLSPNIVRADAKDFRLSRLERLLEARDVHTRDGFIEYQQDTISPAARGLLPLIAKNLWFSEPPAPSGTLARRRADALQMLADWNGDMNEHMAEPLIYTAWMRALQQRLINDELSKMAEGLPVIQTLFLERVFRDVDGASIWCDVVQSEEIETCDQIASLALDDSLLWLEETFGRGDLSTLRWGDAHQTALDHPILSWSRGFSFMSNIRLPFSGGDTTLFLGFSAGASEDPFQADFGSTFRGVYDLSDPNSSVYIASTGQSGHFLSRFYDDLGRLWRRGEYVPMYLERQLVNAGSVGTTSLLPLRN